MQHAGKARVITIAGLKGGTGKTTIASHLLVSALLAGLNAAGVDMDHQGSLATWARDRHRRGRDPAAPVIASLPEDWADVVATEQRRDLLVVDTPPGADTQERVAALRELASHSHLTLMPALPHGGTLRKLVSVAQTLRERRGAEVVFVLNSTIAGRMLLADARRLLASKGELCTIEIPLRDAITRALDTGAAVVEQPGAAGREQMAALWDFVARRVGLHAVEAA